MLQQNSHSTVTNRVQELLSKSLPPLHRGMLDKHLMKLRKERNAKFSSAVFSSGVVPSAMQALRDRKAPRLDAILSKEDGGSQGNKRGRKKKKKKRGKKKKKKMGAGMQTAVIDSKDTAAGTKKATSRKKESKRNGGYSRSLDNRDEGALNHLPFELQEDLPPSALLPITGRVRGGRLPATWNQK